MRNVRIERYAYVGLWPLRLRRCTFLDSFGSVIISSQLSQNPRKRIFGYVRTVKIHISLCVHAVCSGSTLGKFWIAMDTTFLHADNDDSDQTVRMRRLICVFIRHTCQKPRYVFSRCAQFVMSRIYAKNMQDCRDFCLIHSNLAQSDRKVIYMYNFLINKYWNQ